MSKSTHFIGQSIYGQLIDLLDKQKVLDFSKNVGSEKYVKSFDAWQHLLVMLYAVIKRLDSLREISASMYPESRKLSHTGLTVLPRRSTLSDANARRSEKVFEKTYRDLYQTYKDELSSDSRKGQTPKWFEKLQIIDPHHHISVLQSHLQRCWQASQAREKERRNQSTHNHTCKRRRAIGHQIHICSHK